MAARENILIGAVHLPFPGIGRLRAKDGAFTCEPLPWQLFRGAPVCRRHPGAKAARRFAVQMGRVRECPIGPYACSQARVAQPSCKLPLRITPAHFSISLAMRACACSELPPVITMPSAASLSTTSSRLNISAFRCCNPPMPDDA